MKLPQTIEIFKKEATGFGKIIQWDVLGVFSLLKAETRHYESRLNCIKADNKFFKTIN